MQREGNALDFWSVCVFLTSFRKCLLLQLNGCVFESSDLTKHSTICPYRGLIQNGFRSEVCSLWARSAELSSDLAECRQSSRRQEGCIFLLCCHSDLRWMDFIKAFLRNPFLQGALSIHHHCLWKSVLCAPGTGQDETQQIDRSLHLTPKSGCLSLSPLGWCWVVAFAPCFNKHVCGHSVTDAQVQQSSAEQSRAAQSMSEIICSNSSSLLQKQSVGCLQNLFIPVSRSVWQHECSRKRACHRPRMPVCT